MSDLGVWQSPDMPDIIYSQDIKNQTEFHYISIEVKDPLEPTVRELTPETIIEYVEESTLQAPFEQLLTNVLILDRIVPYLQAPDLMALSATSRNIHAIITRTPYVFRHLDLTRCRILSSQRSSEKIWAPIGDFVDPIAPPLHHVFSKLARQSILQDVRTLILDGLYVPATIVRDIIEDTNVKILSIRQCLGMDQRELRRVIEQAVRPGRLVGTPKIKGIYFFSPVKKTVKAPKARVYDWWASRRLASNARGAVSNSSDRESKRIKQQNEWYSSSGQVLSGMDCPSSKEWAYTLQRCEGIIAFDAVLCQGSRHNASLNITDALEPVLATVALGPGGCDVCHRLPEGTAIWSPSAGTRFPLLYPVPLHSSSVSAAQCPDLNIKQQPCLNARCVECLEGHWCRTCNKWICSDCIPNPVEMNIIQPGTHAPSQRGVSQDCAACGPTCGTCKVKNICTCQSCGIGYCLDHDIGSNARVCRSCHAIATSSIIVNSNRRRM